VHLPGVALESWYDVGGSGPDDVWFIGFGEAVRWDGSALRATYPRSGTILSGVWAWSRDDAWLVGMEGTIRHWTGGDEFGPYWEAVPGGEELILEGVWGSGPNDIWMVGFDTLSTPSLLHWDGSGVTAAGPDVLALGVWGAAADDVWVVGASTLHWDGVSWSAVPGGAARALEGVHGSASTNVWAVGVLGTTVHWNGAEWTPIESPAGTQLNGVWTSSPDDAWAVGMDGVILHRSSSP
jgi:hypothetical protein